MPRINEQSIVDAYMRIVKPLNILGHLHRVHLNLAWPGKKSFGRARQIWRESDLREAIKGPEAAMEHEVAATLTNCDVVTTKATIKDDWHSQWYLMWLQGLSIDPYAASDQLYRPYPQDYDRRLVRE